MKTLGKVLLALFAATGSVSLTWPFGPTILLIGYAASAAFLIREFIQEDDNYVYCEYRDRIIRIDPESGCRLPSRYEETERTDSHTA